jgi:hypothetical protein
MSNREVMQQALEALEDERYVTKYTHIVEAITALHKALAQPEFYQPAASEAVEILKSLGYVYEPTYTGLAWVAKKSAQPEQQAEPVKPAGQLQECIYGRGQVLWFAKPADRSMLYTTPPAAAQPEQEPVAWRVWSPDGTNVYQYTEDGDGEALYITPPAAQPEQQAESVAYDKTELNRFVQSLYDEKMQEGKHGHYETMFYVVHQAIKKVAPPKQQAEPVAEKGLPASKCKGLADCGYIDGTGRVDCDLCREQQAEPIGFITPPGPITQYRIPTQRPWVGLTDEEVAIASAEFDTKLKLAFHAGMYKAQIILRKKNDPTY